MALKFHFERTDSSLKTMIEFGAEELETGPYIQTAEMILNNMDLIENNKHALSTILDRLASRAFDGAI